MPRKVKKLPDYFTMEEAAKLVQATESGDARLAMRLMLRCGLRVSEALQVRPSQLRFDRSPPIISLPADIVGNKAKTAREIPIPEDLVEILRDRASGETKARNRPLVELSRQAVGQGMKKAAAKVGIQPSRVHPHAFRHTYGRHCILRGVPVNVLQKWLGHSSLAMTMQYVYLAGRTPFVRGPDMNGPFERWELDGYPPFSW